MERAESDSGQSRPVLKSFRDFSSVRVECTELGASASLGSLSVPSAWPTSAAKPEPTPNSGSKPPGLTYQDGLMGVMTGHPAAPADAEASVASEA
ncbi:hypothetical protein A5647_04630 [Mycobacterium sp. 1100029.7]|nr:hypothetical protein A5647_04630 [Mycobacterium sp. 1100029.7]